MHSPLVNEDQTHVNEVWLEMAESSTADDSMLGNDANFEKELASHISKLVASSVTPSYMRIAKTWRELGLAKEWRKQRIDDIITANEQINANIANAEETSLQKMRSVRDTKERELQVLINELGEENFVPPPNLTLMGTARSFYLKCEELRTIKEKRMTEWVSLKNTKSELHILLGIDGENGETHDIPYSVPRPKDLLKLMKYVNTLEEQKRSRFKNFITLRKSVVSLFEQLEKEAKNDFECQLISSDVEKFILSIERLNKVTELYHKLQEEAETNSKRRKQLMDKLITLWEILEISETDKAIFKSSNISAKPSTLKRIEEEICKLEEIKRENMGLFVQRMRPEIVALWDKCLVGPKRREYFSVYFDDTDYNDELLEIHERELEKYRQHYEEINTILMGVKKYNEMWERFLELEKKATDPARLKNRGGALLKESNERQKLQKDIPKLENSLLTQSRIWSEAHDGDIIYFNDVSMENYFKNKWSEFSLSKELEKKSRQLQKNTAGKGELKGLRGTQRMTPGKVLRKTPVQKFQAANNQGVLTKSSNKRTPLSPINRPGETPKRCNRNVQPTFGQSSNKEMNIALSFGNSPLLNSTFNVD